MNRRDFLKSSATLGLAAILPANALFSANSAQNGVDKLTDSTGNFAQLPLPYAYNFLEPIIDEETLRLHYTFHHGDAVKAANKDLFMIKKALAENKLDTVDFWTKKLSYHLSSHILHTIFWTNLTNKKSDPKGELLKRINANFGSFGMLKKYLAKTCNGVDGNGWGILGYQLYTDKLTILQCENHEKLTQWGVVPLLVIDVWEHSYYLKYKNRRSEFVEKIFDIINWDNVADRLRIATQIK